MAGRAIASGDNPGRCVLAVRRAAVVAAGPAILMSLVFAWDVTVVEVTAAPLVVAIGFGLILGLTWAASEMALVAVVQERRGKDVSPRLDRAWRAAAIACVTWFVVFATAWAIARTVWADRVAVDLRLTATTAPLTAFYQVMVLLAVGSLSLRLTALAAAYLAPLQLLLNAPPGGAPDVESWLNAGYYGTQVALYLGALIWMVRRSRRLDRAEAERSAEERLLTEERAVTVARHRADDFIHDDILSILGPVATGRVTNQAAQVEARSALRALVAQEAGPPPADVAELVQAIRAEVARWEASGDAVIELEERVGISRALHPDVATALLRVVSEALSNSLRHAGPDGRAVRRQVTLEAQRRGLRIDVVDDGVGFDPDRITGRYGVINSMGRRATDAGVDVAVSSGVGAGVAVAIELAWTEPAPPEDLAEDQPVTAALDLRGARWIAGALVAFHVASTIVHLDAYTVAWVSPLCLCLALGCGYLVMRPWGGSMPGWVACLVVAGVALSNGAQAAVLPEVATPGWRYWSSGAGLMLSCGMIMRGRPWHAWGAMLTMVVSTGLWVAASGLPWSTLFAYNGGHVLVLSMWHGLVLWAERSRRAIAVEEREARAVRLQRRVEEETQRVMRRTRALVVRRARPVLERIASGAGLDEDLRMSALLLEAELRDEIRARCFTGTPVALAARRARERGVNVILMDDSGALTVKASEARDRMAVAVAEVLDASTSGRVVVRVPPRSRADAVVVTRDGQRVLQLGR